MSAALDVGAAYLWTEKLTGVYLILDSAEKLAVWREFQGRGVFSWEHVGQARVFGALRKPLRLLLAFRPWMVLLGMRLFCALGMLLSVKAGQTLFLAFILFSGLLINFRNQPFGVETQNRMGLLVLFPLLIHRLSDDHLVAVSGLWFIAAQSSFSYFTAGISKAMRPEWRTGQGLCRILQAESSSLTASARGFLDRRPVLARAMGLATVAFEITFPLAFLGGPVLVVYLAAGIAFHLLIAAVLRIRFAWIWWATYPAIVFASR